MLISAPEPGPFWALSIPSPLIPKRLRNSPMEASLSQITPTRPLGLICQSGDHRHFSAAAALISTAVNAGREAHLFLTHEALFAFMEQDLEDAPSGFGPSYGALYDAARDSGRLRDPLELIQAAKAKGKVRIYGCSASIKLRQGYERDALARLDGITGHTSFLGWAEPWQLLFLG